MNKLTFKFSDGYYRQAPCRDQYLEMLSGIFDEGRGWLESVKERLFIPSSRGIVGNKDEVIIDGDKITIQPQFTDTPEEWAIEIDKKVLLDLINKWQELVQKDAREITFTRHEDGSITITGAFTK